MGTPALAAEVLQIVHSWSEGEVVAVYTQPDRPSGRGQHKQASAVKELAQKLSLKVEEPVNFKDHATIAHLQDYQPDFLLVTAYGLILPQAVLDLAKFPPLNLHLSLLPKYRGAAPIQRAIMEEFTENATTGISIIQIIKELDAGGVYAQKSLAIAKQTFGELSTALAKLGGKELLVVMQELIAGTAKAIAQDEKEVTWAAKINKEDCLINWQMPVVAIDAQIRALSPSPKAKINLEFQAKGIHTFLLEPGQILSLDQCRDLLKDYLQEKQTLATGAIYWNGNNLILIGKDAGYLLETIQMQGRKLMTTKAFVNGFLQDFIKTQNKGLCGKVAE